MTLSEYGKILDELTKKFPPSKEWMNLTVYLFQEDFIRKCYGTRKIS